MRFIKFALCIFILIIPSIGNAAGGECVQDGNETAATATPADFIDSFTDIVCPDDMYDYYVVQIPQGMAISGYVRLDAMSCPGTSLRISNSNGVIYTGGTTYQQGILVFKIPEGQWPAGPYYVRVGFWSEYATEHYYTLTFNIEDYNDVTEYCPPWAMERGDARNTGCSKFPGPGENIVESRTINLFSLHQGLLNFEPLAHGDEFHSIRTGPDGWVYFVVYRSDKPEFHGGQAFGYNIMTNQGWPEVMVCENSTFGSGLAINRLDPATSNNYPVYTMGQVYYLQPVSLDGTHAPSGLMLDTTLYEFNGPPRLLSLGSKICIGSPIKFAGMDMDVFQMFEDKTKKRIAGGYAAETPVVHVCQDELGNIWCRNRNEALMKFNPDGESAWDDRKACSTIQLGNDYPPYFMWPIMGDDGLVWCASVFDDPDTTDIYRYYGGQFGVFWSVPAACVKLKSGSYGGGKVVVSACYGSDLRLYVVTSDGAIACYENWTDKMWETDDLEKFKVLKTPEAMFQTTGSSSGSSSGNGGTSGIVGAIRGKGLVESTASPLSKAPDYDITDMILDKDNLIYVVRTFEGKTSAERRCKLSVLDPVAGEVLASMVLEVPGKLGQKSWLAIASDKRLVWLNSAGWLKVFMPKLTMKKNMKMEVKQNN